MKRRQFISNSIVGAGAMVAAPATFAQPPSATAKAAPAPKPLPPPKPLSPSGAFDVGQRAQLFIEHQVVSSCERISFTPHAATKHALNPLVKADRPWEGWRINVYGTVLFDEEEQLFKMWYAGHTSEWFPGFATHYAVSQDGIKWEKPPVGTVVVPGLAGHNAVRNWCQIASVIKDSADPDPQRRYKMIEMSYSGAGRGKPIGGPHAVVSPDGLNWTRVSTKNLFRSNDVAVAFYDRERRLYVAFPKLSTPVRGVIRRCFGLTTSGDFATWPDPHLVLQPDVRDDAGTLSRVEAVRRVLDVPDDPALMRTEFYGLGAYQAESCIVGFPWVFSINNNARYPTDRSRNHEGPCDIQLAVSRDLETWQRPFRSPVVALGQAGEWDSGFLTTASHAFRYKDEIRLYYGGGNYTHGNPVIYDEYQGSERGRKYTCSIGLATWPLDRFVSADGGKEGGVLNTVPLHFSGRRLELNVNARRGAAFVEILDPAGNTIPGFAKSDAISVDSLRQTVSWGGNTSVAKLAGRPVCLRIHLKEAELYSFAFRA